MNMFWHLLLRQKLLKKDTSIFSPVLSRWHPQAAVTSASLLHRLYGKKLIESKSGTVVLRWVNGQLERIETWVKRATEQEAWDPISPQQRHGGSIVEVYRIIQEAAQATIAVGSQVWIEDPDVAWIDGEVIRVHGDSITVKC